MKIKKYKKKDKTYYMFQAYGGIDPATGKQKGITRRGFATEKEAQEAYYRIKLGLEGNLSEKKYTFKEVYDLWIEEYKNTVKESTLNKTQTLFRCHILPEYGNLYIDMIKVNHCQKAVNKWFKKIKGYRMANTYAGLVFRHAIKLGIIDTNPTKLITIPVKLEAVDGVQKKNYYSKDELNTFINSIATPKWQVLFRVLAYTGCRKGEALALTWKDINFKDSTINISKTLSIGLGNRQIVQTPKTKNSKRVISVDPVTMQNLKEWKKKQASDMLKLGFNTLQPKQLVFSSAKNTYIHGQKIGQVLERYARSAGIRVITPHGLRHTHCSLLFEAGASIKEVQDRLGHADIQTTLNIYAHVTEKKKEETALKFAEYLNS